MGDGQCISICSSHSNALKGMTCLVGFRQGFAFVPKKK